MDNSLSVINANYNKKISDVEKGVVDGMDVVSGEEGIEVIDKALYRVDKVIENGIKGVMNYFQTSNIFIEDLMEYKTKTPSITSLHKVRPTFMKLVKVTKFKSVENRKAPVIMGLKLSYAELLKVVESNASYINGLDDTMVRFNIFLDKLLDSKKGELNISIDKSEVSAIDNNVKNINKSLDTVTSDTTLKDRTMLKFLTSDFRELEKTINDTLKLGSVYRMENLEHTFELNEVISGKLDLLYKALKNKDVVVSKSDVREFSNYIGNIAKLTTAVGFLFYLYYQLVDMLVASVRIIELENEDHSVVDRVARTLRDGYSTLLNVFK